jgi:acetyl esterase/lipase
LGGLVVHLTGWCALILRLWIIFNLPERLDQKMEQQLGNNWKNTSANFDPPGSILDINWHSWFNPNIVFEDPRIEIIREQVFHQENDLQLKLDFYRPKGSKKLLPAILQIHGGAWISGSKRQAALLMTHMAVQGWACFSVVHRFSPDIVFPEHLIDIKHALQWIRNNAEEYGVDPDFIVVTGGSAGGHLASLMALTQNKPEFQPGFEKTDTSIQGCVSLYGVFDFSEPFNDNTPYPAKAKLLEIVCGGTPDSKPECYNQITPAYWISEETPSFLLVQGETDALIPVNETQTFFHALQSQNSQNSAMLSLPLVEHAFDIFPTLTAQCIVPTIERYLVMLHDNHINRTGGK